MKKKFTSLMILLIIFIHPSTAQKTTILPGIKLTNVYDAFGDEQKGLHQDFGFSCLIQYGDKLVLFDAGTHIDTFKQNIKTLKINLKKVDIAILSHGHYDHMGGFDYLLKVNPKVKIYLPKDFFSLGAPTVFPFRETEPELANSLPKKEQYFGGEKVVEGMETFPSGRFWKNNVVYLTKATEIFQGLIIIPTTSKLMGTYIKYPPFEENPNFIGMPELSASFSTPNGQVIIAGCSHSTIETIIQETKKVLEEKILLVAGGFHLIPYKREYIEGLAQRMKEDYGVEFVAPSHCTGHLGFSIFHQVFGNKYKYFGLGEKINFE